MAGALSRPRIGRSFAGLGLFATRDYRRGERICEYTGRKVLAEVAFRKENRYLFWLDEKYVIDGSARKNLGRYLNHACKPNAHADIIGGKIVILASRKILAGEEMTLNYGKEYLDDYIGECKCGCKK